MTGAALSWPEKLTPELREILGFICFQLGSLAHRYRAAGEFVAADGAALESRAEDEQAFMLHKLIGFWIEAGPDWKTAASADIERVVALASKGGGL